MERKKILIIFGTRPEAIKMACLVKAFENSADAFIVKTCVSGQHREMLQQVLDFFGIKPNFDLNLMRPDQNLYNLTAGIIMTMQAVLESYKPDYVFVHGDTTTTMATSIAAFYAGAQVCHVEAGLRTFNKLSPFPEELNRQLVGRIADYHFAPTEVAKDQLLREGTKAEHILVTGNSVIDALLYASERIERYDDPSIVDLKTRIETGKKLVLVTGHRRENHGSGFINICCALKQLAERNADIQIVYPVHLNPNVQGPVYNMLSGITNIKLIDPLVYPAFIWLMKRSYLILTDSGGIQEEAPSLGKPVLVMRDTTERPEAVDAGAVILVGTDTARITEEVQRLLDDAAHYEAMRNAINPYGDGKTCERIVAHMKNSLIVDYSLADQR